MTVPPWEFFPRVLPDIEFAEGQRDSNRLRSVSGAVGWWAWNGKRSSRSVQHALELARGVRESDDCVNTFLVAQRVLAELGALSWDGSAVMFTTPPEEIRL